MISKHFKVGGLMGAGVGVGGGGMMETIAGGQVQEESNRQTGLIGIRKVDKSKMNPAGGQVQEESGSWTGPKGI